MSFANAYMLFKNRYVHAELHGAASTVIKNHKPENPVPPLTLNQAGCFTVSCNVLSSSLSLYSFATPFLLHRVIL